MSAIIDEHTQFVGIDGKPLVNGSIYIGAATLDPVLNPITIYSDRALSVAISNPQTLDSQGRSTNKIYVPGRYSLRINDEDAVQQYINLDLGEVLDAGITAISNVLGTNAITGEATPTITSYTDGETYVFKAANAITGAVTLNFDSVGAKALVYDFDKPLFRNQIQQNQIVAAVYNSSNDNFEWRNPNRSVRWGNKGADIASAATVDLSLLTGNSGVITGATGPITSFGTTPAGSQFLLKFTGAPTITHHATSNIIDGGASITIVVGDRILVESLGAGNNQITAFRASGGLVNLITQALMGAASIGQAELKTTTGDMSTTAGSTLITGPGGEYGFWPTTKNSSTGSLFHKCVPLGPMSAETISGSGHSLTTSFVQNFMLGNNGAGANTITARQRYFQASPPYDLGDGPVAGFIYLDVNKNGKVISAWAAEDPPWANNGPSRYDPRTVYKKGNSLFFTRKVVAALSELGNPNPQVSREVEVEITTAYKNLDMPLIPHPFQSRNPDSKAIVIVDPVSKMCLDLMEKQWAGDSITDLFCRGYFSIDNIALSRKSPNGVDCHAVKLK